MANNDTVYPPLKLGNNIFSDLSVEKTARELLTNTNKVYIHDANDGQNQDVLQLDFDADNNLVFLGSVKSQKSNSTDQGEIQYKSIYLKTYTGDQSSSDESIGGGGGSGSGGTIIGNYVQSINAGYGISLSGSASNPIISVNTSVIGSGGGVSSPNNPDYLALLEFLKVMEVIYEGDVTNEFDMALEYTNKTRRDVTGIRIIFEPIDNNNRTFNCIRIKNDGVKKDVSEKIYLKVIESPERINDTDISNAGINHCYAKIGDVITTVSSNSVNQSEDKEWYEWYFPKNVVLKPGYEYVIIPHHDKSYELVTESTRTLSMLTTSDIDTSNQGYDGVWTSNRSERIGVEATPIIQFCTKEPTTIIITK